MDDFNYITSYLSERFAFQIEFSLYLENHHGRQFELRRTVAGPGDLGRHDQPAEQAAVVVDAPAGKIQRGLVPVCSDGQVRGRTNVEVADERVKMTIINPVINTRTCRKACRTMNSTRAGRNFRTVLYLKEEKRE